MEGVFIFPSKVGAYLIEEKTRLVFKVKNEVGVVGCVVSEILVIIVVFSCIPRKGYSEVAIIVIIVDARPKTVFAYLIDVVLSRWYLDG